MNSRPRPAHSAIATHPHERPDLSGRVLDGRHELLERIGQGGMCDVYRAFFLPGETYEAIKILDAGVARDEEQVRRFVGEFRMLHRLEHPALVQREAILDEAKPSATVVLHAFDPKVPSHGEPLSSRLLVLLQRESGDVYPPAVGDTLPSLALAGSSGDVFALPQGRAMQLTWYGGECPMIWPQMEDVAWRARVAHDLQGDPMIVADTDVHSSPLAVDHGLDALASGFFAGEEVPSEVLEANAAHGDDILQAFIAEELPGPTYVSDMVLDEDGRLLSIERLYRGRWTLVEPWPWE